MISPAFAGFQLVTGPAPTARLATAGQDPADQELARDDDRVSEAHRDRAFTAVIERQGRDGRMLRQARVVLADQAYAAGVVDADMHPAAVRSQRERDVADLGGVR